MSGTPGSALIPAPRRADVAALVGAFESETAAVIARTTPARGHLVLRALVVMTTLAVVLSAMVKLDRVVTGQGRIVPVSGSLYVAPLDRAIVREVRVQAGDVVRKGQVLATLDSTFTDADIAQLEQKLASLEAQVARLEAEHDGKPYVPAGDGPQATMQAAIWKQRQAEYAATLADFDARLASARASVAQQREAVTNYGKRLRVAQELERMQTDLVEKGYVSKRETVTATDNRVELGRLLADAEHQIEVARQTREALKAQRETYVQKWHADAGDALVTVRNELNRTREDQRKASKLSELLTLNAPADAVVLNVGKVSVGSIAAGGSDQSPEPLFTLVPLDAPLEAEVSVNAQDIGFIAAGDAVELKLDAYRFLQHGTVPGIIKTISEGSFSIDPLTHLPAPPHFRVRVALGEVKLRNVPDSFRLIPGMTLFADVVVGERTILSYFLEGAMKTGSEAMREPL